MNKLVTTLAALMLGAVALPAFAGANTPRVDQRQMNQERRIDQGIASGELTKREAARLDQGQDRIDNLENKAKADGTVTRRERARLHHAQNVESRRIYRQKHDAQHR
jgi:acyl-coenzyme A synthetase/AMP-(fatty) acid ligase